MNKLKLISLLLFISMLLTACDTYPYKKKIQSEYDWGNPSGNEALCLMIGDITKSMYPYTIEYLDGADLPFSYETKEAHYNQINNESLHFFSKLGFFTEEKVGEIKNKTIYRYDLTDLGRRYVDWNFGGTNFCFGRIVVDSIDDIKDSVNNFGVKERDINITYHVENIPDWVKNSDVDKRFRYSKKMIAGERISGQHTYRILGKNKFKTVTGVSGHYRWASSESAIEKDDK